MADAQDRKGSCGFGADCPGGLGDVGRAEGFQGADGEVSEGGHGTGSGPGIWSACAWILDGLGHVRLVAPLPAPPPRALATAQVRTVKNIVDRIETFHELKGRRPVGRLSLRSINTIVGKIDRLHDAQTTDPDRKLGTLRPYDARHTFALQLSQASDHNHAELERRLGHANDRYLRLYTNPPDDIAADHIEDL